MMTMHANQSAIIFSAAGCEMHHCISGESATKKRSGWAFSAAALYLGIPGGG